MVDNIDCLYNLAYTYAICEVSIQSMKNKTVIQTSESLLVGSILAVIGGYLDSYSYICRGGVFANAETGNIVLFAINIASFKWLQALCYFIPIIAFSIGVFISSSIRNKNDFMNKIHWRQITVLIESVLLASVALIPFNLNLIANSIISLVCGIQVSAFAKIHNNSMASTMCTGNIKSGIQNLQRYNVMKDKMFLKKSILYFACIAWFIIGAMIGTFIFKSLGLKSILLASVGLWVVIFLMFSKERNE